MIYRVHEGGTVLWPDQSVRAEAGQCFEGYDSCDSKAGQAYAGAILVRYRDMIYPAQPEDGEAVLTGVPTGTAHRGWDHAEAPEPEAPKKVVRKKKAKPLPPDTD